MEADKVVVPFVLLHIIFMIEKWKIDRRKRRCWQVEKFLYKRRNAGVHQGRVNELCVEYGQRLKNVIKRQKCNFFLYQPL
jgi:hypothetical protein